MIVVTLALSLFALGACNKQKVEEKSNVSRSTFAYFAGEGEQFAVTIEKGKRERQFIADGKAVDVRDFCELTVTPLKTNDFEKIDFEICGGEESYRASVQSSEFGSYIMDVDLTFDPTSIKLTAGETVEEIELADVLDGALTSNDVIKIAKDAFDDKLQAELEDGKPEREIYVKLISGDRATYYYYVSLIGEGVDYYAALVNPNTGEIISKK